MTESEEQLKRMVMTFRVSELQMLLGYAGKNKTGRKNELQSRALDLVRLNNPTIQLKIKELYKAIQLEMMSFGDRQQTASGNPGILPQQRGAVGLSGVGYSTSVGAIPSRYSTAGVNQLPQTGSNITSGYIPLSSNNVNQSAFPLSPDVKLKKLPFYDVLAELVRPSSLVPQGSGRYQESVFTFSLTPQQANKIATARDLRPGKQDYTIQVQMRFCLLETTCEQEDNFPPNISVKVNERMCPLPNPIPVNKTGADNKRPPRPVNITPLCRISPTVINKIQLNEDAESEIATTSIRCSLLCPLGKMKMVLPCRSKSCDHLQCFDASLYLQMNERKPTWICPVCDKPALYDSLVIDGYFQEALQKYTCTEISLQEDGSCIPLLPKKEKEQIIEKKKADITVETLTDDSSDDEDTNIKEPKTSCTNFKDTLLNKEETESAPKRKQSDVEIITLSDSDSETIESPAKRPNMNSTSEFSSSADSNSLIPSTNNSVNSSGASAVTCASIPLTSSATCEGTFTNNSWSVDEFEVGRRLVFRKSASISDSSVVVSQTSSAQCESPPVICLGSPASSSPPSATSHTASVLSTDLIMSSFQPASNPLSSPPLLPQPSLNEMSLTSTTSLNQYPLVPLSSLSPSLSHIPASSIPATLSSAPPAYSLSAPSSAYSVSQYPYPPNMQPFLNYPLDYIAPTSQHNSVPYTSHQDKYI